MRTDLSHLDRWIVERGEDGGAWSFRQFNPQLHVIASWGEGWDHVSVSTNKRCPTWDEMCWVKDQFFDPEVPTVQYHPPKSNYINCHPYCLHLWRPQFDELPMPPSFMVGPGSTP